MATLRMPLFPLNLVLFPGNRLPLHIFEPRYQLMVRRSMDDRTSFGIVLATDDGLARIGCAADVTNLLKTHDDGRMDIETVGLFPFRILELHDENPLVEATVESLDDDLSPGADIDTTFGAAQSSTHTDAEMAAEILDLYASCHALLHGNAPGPFDNLPGTALSYQIAARLPLHVSVLQDILETRTESERRTKLAEHLREFLPKLTTIRQRQFNANTNGHGPH